MKEVDSEHALSFWLSKAKKGEKVIYYDGLLMMDRQKFFSNGGVLGNEPDRIRAANFAWRLYTDGVVNLVQKKKDQYSYDYIAVKR